MVAEGRTVGGVDVSTLPARLITVDDPQTLEMEVVSGGVGWWWVGGEEKEVRGKKYSCR